MGGWASEFIRKEVAIAKEDMPRGPPSHGPEVLQRSSLSWLRGPPSHGSEVLPLMVQPLRPTLLFVRLELALLCFNLALFPPRHKA